ncbi:NADPH-dependent FMN reductase [Nocardiopsis sp. L17-MgMaSL7]|uniref:NADPH-dependent FMN reductase n=1 Tax=Nocardiopsis sp. L17-MgMaSL7 TaxID=1938893 RepID=UPI000D717779|nr:NAD(P)H-dependent oxidoreductase [Nocardiopsis sp. L17-MgMaSL7]
MGTARPYEPVQVVGVCGSLYGGSTEAALRVALNGAAEHGAQTELLVGSDLELPPYSPSMVGSDNVTRLLKAMTGADAIVLASPAYHGSISGLLKNALDCVEELGSHDPPYLDGKAVGCVSVGAGVQGAANTLRTLRDIAHALRAWPVPMGAALNSTQEMSKGVWDAAAHDKLRLVGRQVVDFALMSRGVGA